MLSLVYRDFICSPEIRQKLHQKDYIELQQIETTLQSKFNLDNIFEKSKNINIETSKTTNTSTLTEYKESFFTRFKNFIFKILHINK